jgi:uncharacterized protein YcaQ
LFEAYNKGLSLLPTAELPWYRVGWERAYEAYRESAFVDHRDAIEHVLQRIRADGPLASIDFERRAAVDWWWGPTNEIRAALEVLAYAGVLGLARRVGNRRYYDLVERLFPAELLATKIPRREQVKHKLLSRYRGHGMLGPTSRDVLVYGIGLAAADPSQPAEPTRSQLKAELIDSGALVPVEVEGVRGPRYIVADEIPLLDAVERAGALAGGPSVTFLAPLDPFVWDREFLRQLFAFDYLWEVYVPEAKRRWGYYVLPLLFGDRLVGRIEPRIDRSDHIVRILGAWWEDGFDPSRGDGFVDAMRAALDEYQRFAGAGSVEWAPRLSRERRLFGSKAARSRRTRDR